VPTTPTDDEKIAVIIEHLTGVTDGGYPGESLWIGDTLAYTAANTGDKYGSRLGSITREEMLAWYDRAAVSVEDDEDDLTEALYETEAA